MTAAAVPSRCGVRRLRRTTTAAAVVVAVSVVAGCAIAPDDAPRDIPLLQQSELRLDADPAAGAAVGAARIYLLTPETSGRSSQLLSVPRDVDEAAPDVLSALLAGPNADELDEQLRTAIPAATELRGAALRGGTLLVDVSAEILQLSGDILVRAVAQIVFTAAGLPGVRAVRLLVDGAERQWPAGNGELQSAPLTPFDYPGLLATTQPDYPAIPSPTA